MKLIIEIDDETKALISRTGLLRMPDDALKIVDEAIQGGTPLSKGHGRLIDVNDIKERNYMDIEYDVVDWDDIQNAPTIIEADKEDDHEHTE